MALAVTKEKDAKTIAIIATKVRGNLLFKE
jgi:hypothetical protein